MVEDRTIKVGHDLAIDAVVHSKRKLEAYSFAVILKIHFVDSQYRLTNQSYIEIAKFCQISEKKAKQVVKDIVSFGYAKINDKMNRLEVGKTYTPNKGFYKFNSNEFIGKEINTTYAKKNDTDKECISLQYVVDKIRKLVLQTHIQRKNFINDTQIGYADAKTLSEVKRHRNNIDKYAISEKFDVANKGISIESFMKVINVKRRNKVKQLLDELVFEGLIQRTKNIIYVGKCKLNTLYKSNEFGCFFSIGNNLYLKGTNEYSLKGFAADRICF